MNWKWGRANRFVRESITCFTSTLVQNLKQRSNSQCGEVWDYAITQNALDPRVMLSCSWLTGGRSSECEKPPRREGRASRSVQPSARLEDSHMSVSIETKVSIEVVMFGLGGELWWANGRWVGWGDKRWGRNVEFKVNVHVYSPLFLCLYEQWTYQELLQPVYRLLS